jgi:hypothetical protein
MEFQMTLQTVLNAVRFVTTGPGAVNLDDQMQIKNTITALWASGTARALLTAAANIDRLYFETDSSEGSAAPLEVSKPININFSEITRLTWFNDKGRAVQASVDLVMIHELQHATSPDGVFDPGYPNLRPSSAIVNQADWVTDGPAVIAHNAVARQLGRAEEVRVSYFGSPGATDPSNTLVTGRNYTEGATIDSVRIGAYEDGPTDGSARIMDERLHATDLRNLIFGSGSKDDINAAAGNDFVYGLGGNDTIRGGAGNDVIYGDDKFDFSVVGDDTLYGDGGNDRIYGGKGTDTIYGGIGADILVGGAGGNLSI